MKKVLILHGLMGTPNENWFPWLKKELEKRNIQVRVPQLPDSNDPDRYDWMKSIKKNLKDWRLEETAVFAHSLGVAAILDYLESQDDKLDLLVSVAGFARAYGFEANQKFMETKPIDLKNVKRKVKRAVVIYSDNDPYVTKDALKELAEGLGVKPIVMKGQKHFSVSTMGEKYNKFPELLKYI